MSRLQLEQRNRRWEEEWYGGGAIIGAIFTRVSAKSLPGKEE